MFGRSTGPLSAVLAFRGRAAVGARPVGGRATLVRRVPQGFGRLTRTGAGECLSMGPRHVPSRPHFGVLGRAPAVVAEEGQDASGEVVMGRTNVLRTVAFGGALPADGRCGFGPGQRPGCGCAASRSRCLKARGSCFTRWTAARTSWRDCGCAGSATGRPGPGRAGKPLASCCRRRLPARSSSARFSRRRGPGLVWSAWRRRAI